MIDVIPTAARKILMVIVAWFCTVWVGLRLEVWWKARNTLNGDAVLCVHVCAAWRCRVSTYLFGWEGVDSSFSVFFLRWKAASPRSAATLWCYDNFVVNTFAFSNCVTRYNTDKAGDGWYQKYDKSKTLHEHSETWEDMTKTISWFMSVMVIGARCLFWVWRFGKASKI